MKNPVTKMNSKKIKVDLGTPEKHQHNIYEKRETPKAGIVGLRNSTIDPLETYKKRKIISDLQFQAGSQFAFDFRLAKLNSFYSSVDMNKIAGYTELSIQEKSYLAKTRIRECLIFIGSPLCGVLEHVCGHQENAGTWEGVKYSKRQKQDGIVALKLALTGLISFYKL